MRAICAQQAARILIRNLGTARPASQLHGAVVVADTATLRMDPMTETRTHRR